MMSIVYILATIGGTVLFIALVVMLVQLIKILYNLYVTVFILRPSWARERDDWREEQITGVRVYRIKGKKVTESEWREWISTAEG